MDVYEAVSGTRMHATYYRPGGGVPRSARCDAEVPGFQVALAERSRTHERGARRHHARFHPGFHHARFPSAIDDYETLLTDNRIWKQRTVKHRGGIPAALPAAGLLRSDAARLSIAWDLRKSSPTKCTSAWISMCRLGRERRTATTATGAGRRDAPVEPHRCVSAWSALRAHPGAVVIDDRKVRPPRGEQMKEDMESLIHHFKLFTARL